jgi:aldehyde:ferredoxin oxidoreductase
MELGRKIFTLDRAIWTLQGRDRDMEVFPDYIYEKDSGGEMLPMYDDKTGKWSYSRTSGRRLDRTRVEEWKTKFYEFEGFSADNGWPTRETLERMNLKRVADTMGKRNRLG